MLKRRKGIVELQRSWRRVKRYCWLQWRMRLRHAQWRARRGREVLLSWWRSLQGSETRGGKETKREGSAPG